MKKHTNFFDLPGDGIEITETIYDKYGDEYTIIGHLSGTGFSSYVHSRTGCIGRINWDTSQAGVLLIADLIIFEPLDIKRWWERIFPFLYKQPDSLKGRGLGSAMLTYIIASAQAMGVSEIRGWITSDDIEATPYLVGFYRKHGFIVNDSDLTFYQVLE